MEVPNETLFRIGGILHESRMTECYGEMQLSTRRKWPATLKEFRGQQMAGQPWIDVAVAQVRALVKAGIISPEGDSLGAGQG